MTTITTRPGASLTLPNAASPAGGVDEPSAPRARRPGDTFGDVVGMGLSIGVGGLAGGMALGGILAAGGAFIRPSGGALAVLAAGIGVGIIGGGVLGGILGHQALQDHYAKR